MKCCGAALILLICSFVQAVQAQAGDWVSVAPDGERFVVQMPQDPTAKTEKRSFEQFNIEARIYTATKGNTDYTVWSLHNESFANYRPVDGENYLDDCADLVSGNLIGPLDQKGLGKLLKPLRLPGSTLRMPYQRELFVSGLPGREYFLLGARRGLVQFFSAGERVYVLTVLNGKTDDRDTQRFVNSFSYRDPSSKAGQGTETRGVGMGLGPGPGGFVVPARETGAVDYNRVFLGKDVTRKARRLSKVRAPYPDSALKYEVRGTVALRVIISNSGEVNHVVVVKGLPHGLTQKAVEAARKTKFSPATKDGHLVAQLLQMEFSFSLD